MTTTEAVTPEIRANRITRSMLGYGVLAGPLYAGVSLAQALTRDGFDVTRHAWSLLSNGSLGWLQITNFILTGLMVLTAGVGLTRAGARWTGRLVAVFGLSMVAAGVLRADPAQGFPAGTPDGAGVVTWHGVGHLVAGAVGFLCVAVAAWLSPVLKPYSRVSGTLFLLAFIGIASGASSPLVVLGFVAGVLVIFAWLAVVSIQRYRRLPCN
ncbi:DUF998 domain-containing protein [Dactylosporangium matsuzakiense]|uniref:DUF998 domain-containing protein n=1 Tax=Dactylosporangium matsuzakiense TaxID=53360 RepID=A0A9W6NR78_9ACTN|nr:DUF998 domain-containing protein [Dactylosporangium matsuzakiense]UWZ41781.1 DUF998 domain-containing protein [Dactylosporangium matsuzakiense]GLL06955.1 hypothetical protein GCM10017581_087050 [Dactylosporangium matsuzakiense]